MYNNIAAIPNAERKVFEKKIDDGYHMLVKGQFEEAGIRNATGMVEETGEMDEGLIKICS